MLRELPKIRQNSQPIQRQTFLQLILYRPPLPPPPNYLKHETQHRAQAGKHVGLINLSLHQPGTAARKQMWNMYKEQGKKRMAVAASSHLEKNP